MVMMSRKVSALSEMDCPSKAFCPAHQTLGLEWLLSHHLSVTLGLKWPQVPSPSLLVS